MDNVERAIETARARGRLTLLDDPDSAYWRAFQRVVERRLRREAIPCTVEYLNRRADVARRVRFGRRRRWFTALAAALFLQGCASVEPSDIHEQHLSGIRAATIPHCYQGVSARGYCREGTGRVVQLGLATMIDVGSE